MVFYGLHRSKDDKNLIYLNLNAQRSKLKENFSYFQNIISHEMHKESLYRLSVNFCRKFEINPTGREILIDWLISVQVDCTFFKT